MFYGLVMMITFNWIMPTFTKRLATKNTPDGHEKCFIPGAFLEGLNGIGATGWVKAAIGA
jgi:hypothetical protein